MDQSAILRRAIHARFVRTLGIVDGLRIAAKPHQARVAHLRYRSVHSAGRHCDQVLQSSFVPHFTNGLMVGSVQLLPVVFVGEYGTGQDDVVESCILPLLEDAPGQIRTEAMRDDVWTLARLQARL